MKNLKKEQGKKLFLKKETVTVLNLAQQSKLYGGDPGPIITGEKSTSSKAACFVGMA